MSEQTQEVTTPVDESQNVGNSAAPEANASAPTENRVEFSAEQQKWLNQREKTHKDEVRSLKESLANFESKLANLDPNSFNNVYEEAKKRDDKNVQIDLLTKRIQEMEQSQIQNSVQSEIRSAIDMAGVDPKYANFVTNHVRQFVQYDNGLKVVNPETGAQRFSMDGTKPLSVADVVAETLQEYSAFRPKTPTGAGVRVEDTQAVQTDNSFQAKLKALDPTNPADRKKMNDMIQSQITQDGGGVRKLNITTK